MSHVTTALAQWLDAGARQTGEVVILATQPMPEAPPPASPRSMASRPSASSHSTTPPAITAP